MVALDLADPGEDRPVEPVLRGGGLVGGEIVAGNVGDRGRRRASSSGAVRGLLRGQAAEQRDEQQQPAGDQPQQPLQRAAIQQRERDPSSDRHGSLDAGHQPAVLLAGDGQRNRVRVGAVGHVRLKRDLPRLAAGHRQRCDLRVPRADARRHARRVGRELRNQGRVSRRDLARFRLTVGVQQIRADERPSSLSCRLQIRRAGTAAPANSPRSGVVAVEDAPAGAEAPAPVAVVVAAEAADDELRSCSRQPRADTGQSSQRAQRLRERRRGGRAASRDIAEGRSTSGRSP